MLCILFDDMRGDVDKLPALQVNVISDVCAWSNAKRFIVCPTYYSYDSRLAREFGPPPKTYLRDLGRMLDSRIDVFGRARTSFLMDTRYSILRRLPRRFGASRLFGTTTFRMIQESVRIVYSSIPPRMRGNYPLPRWRASRSIQQNLRNAELFK